MSHRVDGLGFIITVGNRVIIYADNFGTKRPSSIIIADIAFEFNIHGPGLTDGISPSAIDEQRCIRSIEKFFGHIVQRVFDPIWNDNPFCRMVEDRPIVECRKIEASGIERSREMSCYLPRSRTRLIRYGGMWF